MSIVAHLETLEEKHTRLDAAIAEEASRPSPDFTYMTTLKKEKLLIKQEMERLKHYRSTHTEVARPKKANAS